MSEKRKTKKRKEELGDPADEKPTKEEYAVAKWMKSNVPTKKTKFLNHHVEYFTGAKAVDALLTSRWASGDAPLFATRHDVADYLHLMLLHKMFHRAKKVPVSEQELKGKSKKREGRGDESAAEGKDPKDGKEGKDSKDGKEGKDGKEAKDASRRKPRKIRLEMHQQQAFTDGLDAYVWLYAPRPWYHWLCGALVVLAAVVLCLFPLWPPTVKKGVYYLSVAAAGFLVLIIALAVLRVVVFCAVWALSLARHHLWLLPNLTEDVGFFASFWPLYQYEYRGPGAEKSSKKKKRKKEKHSDDEEPKAAEERPPAEPVESAQEPLLPDKVSESESENSQRSSTDRDFEIVDPGELEAEAKDQA